MDGRYREKGKGRNGESKRGTLDERRERGTGGRGNERGREKKRGGGEV